MLGAVVVEKKKSGKPYRKKKNTVEGNENNLISLIIITQFSLIYFFLLRGICLDDNDNELEGMLDVPKVQEYSYVEVRVSNFECAIKERTMILIGLFIGSELSNRLKRHRYCTLYLVQILQRK